MKIETITIAYEERRSANYQSVGHCISVQVTLEEGDKLADVTRRLQKSLRDRVSGFVETELERITAPRD